ncbi:MAG TPA: D-hexose-6-phosphate mutarotase [Acidobacteriaceae bacterium]|jgi:glucose-6-phosphate 1-epimerase
MSSLHDLNDNFAIPGLLAFEEIAGGLLIARITGAACTATLFLQGAHLVHWQPGNEDHPVLFLSERSVFAPGKAVRGGVPVIFPWFGSRTGERTDGPSHGFARTAMWDVAFAAGFGEDLHLTLTLGPSETSRQLGYDNFRLAYELIFGRTLSLRLSVVNQGETPMHLEEALHTYLAVGGVEHVRIGGLGDTEFLDKTDHFARRWQTDDWLMLHGETDRPYLNTTATVTVDDPIFRRRLVVEKRNSHTTVIWNPWTEQTAKLVDMDPEGWRGMVCVETANAAQNALTLHPGEAHTMEARLAVEPLPDPETAAGGAQQAGEETYEQAQTSLFESAVEVPFAGDEGDESSE